MNLMKLFGFFYIVSAPNIVLLLKLTLEKGETLKNKTEINLI